jgi:hypothetical protein
MKWIQWLLDNSWSVVIVAGVLMQLIQALTKKKGAPEAEEEAEPAKEYEFEDPELAERTRKIREDIQRKIEQRTRGQLGVPDAIPPAPPPVLREAATTAMSSHSNDRLAAERQAQILEEQAAMMARLQEVKRAKAAVTKRLEFESATADHTTEQLAGARLAVLDDLRTPAALRRAFVLREVLGPPVSLRN